VGALPDRRLLLQRLWQARPLSAAGFFKAILPGFVALLWVLPILAYVYLNFGSTPPETTAQARQLTVEFRIPHHALLSWWFDTTALIKIGLLLLALFLVRKTRLSWALGVPFVLALLLTLAATPSPLFSGSYFLALLFPWRVSIFLVPLSTALILAWLVRAAWERLIQPVQPPEGRARRQRSVSAASLALVAALLLVGWRAWRSISAARRSFPTRPLMAYVAAHRAPTDVYLTPVKMQDFRREPAPRPTWTSNRSPTRTAMCWNGTAASSLPSAFTSRPTVLCCPNSPPRMA
jgi:hypothetical protein